MPGGGLSSCPVINQGRHGADGSLEHARARMITLMAEREPELVWAPPPLDDCEEDRLTIPLDEVYLLSTRRVLWNKQLVAFAVVLTRLVGDRKLEVVCIDTLHHGCVHRHDGDHDSPHTVIREICTQQDVQESFHDAYDEVYNVYLRAMGLDELR